MTEDPVFRRVSVRRFQDRPVEEEKIEALMRAAMAAPSSVDQRPWEFFVVTDRDVIQRLSRCTPYAGCAAGAPLVIVPCVDRSRLRLPEMAGIDMGIVTENILLEAVVQGLGAVCLGVAPFEEFVSNVDGVLGIGDRLHAFAMIPVGYPAASHPQRDRYEADRVHRVRCGPAE